MPTGIILARPMNRRDETGEIEGEKLLIVGEDGVRNRVFARLFGNDDTGDGSAGNPYRTFVRALEDVPIIIPQGQRYIVDITGLGVETLPQDPFRPPTYQSDDGLTLNLASDIFPNFINESPLTVAAAPIPATGVPVADTLIAPGEIVSQVANADTGLITITTTKVWPVNVFKGKLLAGTGPFQDCAIASNGVSTLEVCSTSALVAPLQIIQPSAELLGGWFIISSGCIVVFNGVKLSRASVVASDLAVANSQMGTMLMRLCEVQGFSSSFTATLISANSCSVRAPTAKQIRANSGGGAQLFNSYLENIDFQQIGGAIPSTLFMNACIHEGGPVTSLGACSFSATGLARRLSTSGGLRFTGSLLGTLIDVRVDGCAGQAVEVLNRSVVDMTKVRGATNTLFGVKADKGSTVQVNSTTDVTGASGDMKVGNQAARTWVNFRTVAPINNEFDIDATKPVTGTGTRLFQV